MAQNLSIYNLHKDKVNPSVFYSLRNKLKTIKIFLKIGRGLCWLYGELSLMDVTLNWEVLITPFLVHSR